MILDRKYYERKDFDSKKTEDILGGEEAWKYVDQTEGETSLNTFVALCD